jgi:hypothetical protein
MSETPDHAARRRELERHLILVSEALNWCVLNEDERLSDHLVRLRRCKRRIAEAREILEKSL